MIKVIAYVDAGTVAALGAALAGGLAGVKVFVTSTILNKGKKNKAEEDEDTELEEAVNREQNEE